ncbi:hypothetical protein Acsp03_58940 [Actinomadura sp. NBRC 104412]|uniref:hypothetical protein n=1 Tax=Actinomadura sp. NBRC 104412 TaxID=3032203 RepID=UPI0024A20BF5|nr:hypothetical protein [Actinomadura sp. NBRC 104412]GLZ08428.1 hypothetical protein Acsp03_58940 [Actinomadura sp. NBRC 104412]
MSGKNRTARLAVGLPLAAALAFSTAGCLGEDTVTRAGTSAKPSQATNGIDKLEGSEAFSRATKATLSASSVRLRGQVQDGEDTITMDFRYAGANRSGGTLQIGVQEIELIRLGSVVYFKGNKPFLEEVGGKEAVTAMSGKYFKTSSKGDPDFADIQGFTNLADLVKEATSESQGWRIDKPGNVGGKPSIALVSLAGDKIHVATQGPPYILQFDDGPQNRIDFLSYNEPVNLKRPPSNLVIDMSG